MRSTRAPMERPPSTMRRISCVISRPVSRHPPLLSASAGVDVDIGLRSISHAGLRIANGSSCSPELAFKAVRQTVCCAWRYGEEEVTCASPVVSVTHNQLRLVAQDWHQGNRKVLDTELSGRGDGGNEHGTAVLPSI